MSRLTMMLILTMVSATLVHGQEPARRAGPSGPSRQSVERARNRAAIAARDRREAAAQAAAMARAEAEYVKMLPYLLIQQRTEMERLSALERNLAMHRMAAAQEEQARAAKRQADNAALYLYYNRPR